MTVRLAPIRPHDLRAGDILQHRHGDRWRLRQRGLWGNTYWLGWHVVNLDKARSQGFIADVDIERTGPHRIWWLDNAVDRP